MWGKIVWKKKIGLYLLIARSSSEPVIETYSSNDGNLSSFSYFFIFIFIFFLFVSETGMYPRRRTAVHIRSAAGGRIDAFSEELHKVRSPAIRGCGYLLEQFRPDGV